jgi:hypothetical protein
VRGRGKGIRMFACNPLKSPDSEKEMKENESGETGSTAPWQATVADKARSCKLRGQACFRRGRPDLRRQSQGRRNLI